MNHSQNSLLYRVSEKKSKKKYLCKVVISNNVSEKQCKEMISYLRKISSIPCTYINKYVQYNCLSDCIYYISKEYEHSLENQNLLHIIESKEYISLIKDIVYTTDILHNNNIINGNIKPSNILFSNEDNHFYLSDYGNYMLSNCVEKREPFIQSKMAMCYLSPEIIRSCEYDLKSNDIWSIGCVLYYILHNGLNPFMGKNIFEIYSNIIYLKYDSGKKEVEGEEEEEEEEENEYFKIYVAIFQSDVQKRPTINKLIDLLSQTNDFKNDMEESTTVMQTAARTATTLLDKKKNDIETNNMLNSMAKENIDNISDIVKFYMGEGLCNYKTCVEYYSRSEDEIRLWCPIYDLSFLFPLVGQNDPPFTIVDQHIFGENDLIKLSYENMIESVVGKYGYLKRDKGNFEIVEDEYEYWKCNNEEPRHVFNRILQSLNSLYPEDNEYITFMENVIKDINKYVEEVIDSDFYLKDKKVYGKSCQDICRMFQNQFNTLKIDKYLPWLFPNENQINPTFTDYDIFCIYFNTYIEIDFNNNKSTIQLRCRQLIHLIISKYKLEYNYERKEVTSIDDYYIKYKDEIMSIMLRISQFLVMIDYRDQLDITNDIIDYVTRDNEVDYNNPMIYTHSKEDNLKLSDIDEEDGI